MADPSVKVTRINKRWHARLILDGKVIDEMACKSMIDIGWICREMLRWFDKMGGDSEFARAARRRQIRPHRDRVWYRKDLY